MTTKANRAGTAKEKAIRTSIQEQLPFQKAGISAQEEQNTRLGISGKKITYEFFHTCFISIRAFLKARVTRSIWLSVILEKNGSAIARALTLSVIGKSPSLNPNCSR